MPALASFLRRKKPAPLQAALPLSSVSPSIPRIHVERIDGSSNAPLSIPGPGSQAPSMPTRLSWTLVEEGNHGEGSDDPELYCVDFSGLAVSSPTSTPIKKSLGWKNISKRGKLAGSLVMYGIQALKESSDVLPPLKSVVGCLAFLLSTYKVRFIYYSASR